MSYQENLIRKTDHRDFSLGRISYTIVGAGGEIQALNPYRLTL